MAKALNNGMNIIDSRDVIKRIEELADIEERDEDEESELNALKAFHEEANADWEDGVALVRDSYFERYAQELAEDTGGLREAVPNRMNYIWPFCHIDWKAAADSLQQDYSSADFDGETYWFLS
jgi:hypothetical protein